MARRMRILLFESNEPMREMIPDVLPDIDFTVTATLAEAQALARSQKVDALITNSPEFADSSSLPTVFISFGASGMPKRGAVLLKPFFTQQLRDAISASLASNNS